jgi:hypothetical protein
VSTTGRINTKHRTVIGGETGKQAKAISEQEKQKAGDQPSSCLYLLRTDTKQSVADFLEAVK